ncbi:MAG: trypsin-like peptidase domain-containing protein [Thiobacillus sp.]|nr:trypsin-like peptidase domain-containing protein [Thiobacillus sp.]
MCLSHKKMAVAVISALSSTSALALVGGSVDANLATSPWAGVGAITINGGVYSGVLLDDQHVLTAAHVVGGQAGTPGNVSFSLNVGGNLTQTLSATAITVYPGFTGTTPGADGVWHDDLAIITLGTPVSGAVPTYGVYGGSLSGTTITLVGYGGGGDGVNGVTSGANASVKRVGQNRADLLLVDDDGGSNNEVFVFDFDGPAKTTNYFGNDNAPSNQTLGATIEVQYAGGDSGSPVFVNDNGTWKIAGIGTFNGGTSLSGESNVLYGSIGGGTIVASYLPWIESTLAAPVPEPQTWLLLLAGIGLVGSMAARAKAVV